MTNRRPESCETPSPASACRRRVADRRGRGDGSSRVRERTANQVDAACVAPMLIYVGGARLSSLADVPTLSPTLRRRPMRAFVILPSMMAGLLALSSPAQQPKEPLREIKNSVGMRLRHIP